jgi:hypothetical protein
MTLRPETELLLLCAYPIRSEATTARVRQLLSGNLDWKYVMDFAGDHRLGQFLCWEMKAIRPDAIPERLERSFQADLKSSLLLTRELVRILAVFERNGIPALPFKGPTLALMTYGNLALRPFDDLDILLRKEDVWRARDLLRQDGYQTKIELNRDREAAYLRSYDEFLMYGTDGFPLLELHWAFVPPHFGVEIGFAGCWERREKLAFVNRVLPALNPEDLLLVLSVHGAKHCWSHLGLIADVAWLMARCPVRWEELLARAHLMGIRRMVLLAASLASDLFHVPLAPPAAHGIAADRDIAAISLEITESIFELNGRKHHNEHQIVRSGLLHMRMRERLRDRVRYFLRLTTRAGVEDWQAVDLPGPLSFLYPFLRFPRLLMKYRSRLP